MEISSVFWFLVGLAFYWLVRTKWGDKAWAEAILAVIALVLAVVAVGGGALAKPLFGFFEFEPITITTRLEPYVESILGLSGELLVGIIAGVISGLIVNKVSSRRG